LINTQSFVEIVEEMIREKVEVPFSLGKIDPFYSGGNPRILFDGEASVSMKRYPYLSTYQPISNDRVLLINIANTHLIVGHVGEYRDPIPEGGVSAIGLNYTWNGTKLGVKREDEYEFQYVNLQGTKGDRGIQGELGIQGIKGDTGETGAQGVQGIQGIKGDTGDSIEYQWSVTSLGIRIEGQANYTYVDLKGAKGDTGGQGIQGERGIQGIKGDQGIQGERGIQGIKGDQGIQGGQGIGLQYDWSGNSLGIKREDQTSYVYQDLSDGLSSRETPWSYVSSIGAGWSNYSGNAYGYARLAYKRDVSNFVHLQGFLRYGSNGILFTLPVGFRPATGVKLWYFTDSNGGKARLDVNPNGTVEVKNITGTPFISLNMSFSIN